MFSKINLIHYLREFGLMHSLDKLKFWIQNPKNKTKNKLFLLKNPNVKLPPDYMMFEAFHLDYEKYYQGGADTAKWVSDRIQKYKTLEVANFLDWGCGPARVVRHLPLILGKDANIFGTDYNPETIDWCTKNISGVTFSQNSISPPLHYDDEMFDAVLGISIFTHLSEEKHHTWVNELFRISKPSSILLITTQGKAFKNKLTKKEKELFDSDKLVVRANVKEGHRVFSAFQPQHFMNKLFKEYFEILEHFEGKAVIWGIEQDYWILRRK